jgi:hypothetical protein
VDLLSRDELRMLIGNPGRPCVTIYMPTHRVGAGTRQDPIRLRNLLQEAEERLIARGLRSTKAKELLEPAWQLGQPGLFWSYQSDGLAIFISPGMFRYYRLPFNFKKLVVVADRFHIKPLLPLLSSDGQLYILALSQNEVSLFQGTRYSVSEVYLENVPESLEEALKYDDPEKQLQFHTRTPKAMDGKRSAMFHGHGVGIDDSKDNIRRYFHQIDAGLWALLRDERAPLVLAGVDYLLPLYREVNSYPYLLDQGIVGNPEGLKAEELHARAWAVVQPYFLKAQQEAVAQYRQFAGTGLTSNDVKETVTAAYRGRVGLLFVAVGIQQWGAFAPDTNVVRLHQKAEPGDEDLLDFAAMHTLLNGGIVYAVKPGKVPDNAPLAAVFRY